MQVSEEFLREHEELLLFCVYSLVQAVAGTLVWRVQLRRGLATVRDTEVSATAVVGVAFDSRAIGSHG